MGVHSPQMDQVMGQVDVVFVVDTTGSMEPFLAEARAQIRRVMGEVAQQGQLDLRFALIEYRDHPPEERSFIARTHGFRDDASLQVVLDGLAAQGGGDHPEAVLDGLIAASGLPFREHADRLCFLVGDAPPHGVGYPGDAFGGGCPCGKTVETTCEQLNSARVAVHAITLTREPTLVASFREISVRTEGSFLETGEVTARAASGAAMRSASVMAVERTRVTMMSTSSMIDTGRKFAEIAARVGTEDRARLAAEMGVSERELESIERYMKKRGLV